jgi:hypothetical protein
LLAGFNGIQLYSFERHGELEMILTNGSPSWRPRPLLGRLFERVFPIDPSFIVDVSKPPDLRTVLTVHEQKLARRNVLRPVDEILETRWRYCEELGLDETEE